MGRASGRRNPTRAGGIAPESPEGREIGESERQDPAGSPIPGLTGNIVNYETPRQQVAGPEPMDQFRGMMAHGVPHEADTTEERATAERGGPNVARTRRVPAEKPRELPPPVPVYLTQPAAGSRPLTTLATARLTIPASTADPVRITGRDETRATMYVMVENAAGSTSNVLQGAPPAVPATGVAAQNTSALPVSVVISANGATITNVVVNGVSVGTAAGTYTVPAFGAISISYTVATPTWTWTTLGVASTAPSGIRIDHEVGTLTLGNGALIKAGASYQEVKGCQDELFAVSNDGSACTLSILYLYQLAGAL
jgi:hypothetical protein